MLMLPGNKTPGGSFTPPNNNNTGPTPTNTGGSHTPTNLSGHPSAGGGSSSSNNNTSTNPSGATPLRGYVMQAYSQHPHPHPPISGPPQTSASSTSSSSSSSSSQSNGLDWSAYVAMVKAHGGAVRSDFRSIYESSGYGGELCAALAARFLLLGPEQFFMDFAMHGFGPTIEAYQRYAAAVARLAALKQAVADAQSEAEALALIEKARSFAAQIPLILYEGHLQGGRGGPSSDLARMLPALCKGDGRWALDLHTIDGSPGHQVGIIVEDGRVSVFDPDKGFLSFGSVAEAGAFLAAYTKLFPDYAGGKATLWPVV
ncbi:Hypothetical protein A7982_02973 [Minicystis rosea]|nr:Hypothetical protein A7982_02973 [Minicystis rosea]